MTFNDLQKKWQSQESGFKLSIASDILLRQVERNKKYFECAIFWRDIREVAVAFLVVIFCLYGQMKLNCRTLYFVALSFIFIGFFLIVDRLIQKKKVPAASDSLLDCIECSLTQVEHQIWLLKNVLWWYLLPPTISISVFYGSVGWQVRHVGGWRMMFIFVCFGLLTLTVLGVYHLNQYAVRKELNPRKQELEQLLLSLKNSNE